MVTPRSLPCGRGTFAGDVVFAGRGEASAAVTVDGCDSELVPTLRSHI